MKSCVIENNRVDVVEAELPSLGPGDVLVRMEACGICGTDVEKVLGHYGSRILGHEAVGVVEKTGSRIRDFSPGDRVFPHHHVPCYECHYCRSGNETMCPHFSSSNLVPGGLSEFFIMPEWNISHGGLFHLPQHLNFRRATLVEPLACVLRALRKVRISDDFTWAVVGAGPVGMLHILALSHLRMGSVLAVEPDGERRNFSKSLGAIAAFSPDEAEDVAKALTDGRGVDVAVVATGSAAAINSAIGFLRKGGTLIQFGLPHEGTALKADMNHLFRNEITIINTYSGIEKDVDDAIRLLEHAEIADKLISHVFPLSQAWEAFQLAMKPSGARKIVIEHN